ncbi:MAG: hypothetical protein Q8865_09775 [Bacillota bacterium]|nr:hypothetical protein [Bacillota bacterium]
MMTKDLFIKKLQDIQNNHKTVYMRGVYGAPVTEDIISYKTDQYPNWYSSERQITLRNLIGKGFFGFDCVCLIKGVLWGWNGDDTQEYGGAEYESNGVPDINADTMITKCEEVTEDFSKIEAGEALWCNGHIGVYIGDGKAVECTSRWSSNVQVTAVGNIGTVEGLNTRVWIKHGKLPYIMY